MSQHRTEICIDLPEFQFGVVATVSFEILGAYAAPTYYHPAEYPELDGVELVSWSIDDDYREDTNVAVDSEAVEKAINVALGSRAIEERLYQCGDDDREGRKYEYAEVKYEEWKERDLDDDYDDCPF